MNFWMRKCFGYCSWKVRGRSDIVNSEIHLQYEIKKCYSVVLAEHNRATEKKKLVFRSVSSRWASRCSIIIVMKRISETNTHILSPNLNKKNLRHVSVFCIPHTHVGRNVKIGKKKKMIQIFVPKINLLKLFFYPEYCRATNKNSFRYVQRKCVRQFSGSPTLRNNPNSTP